MKVLGLLSDGYGCSGGIAQYNRDLVSALSEIEGVSLYVQQIHGVEGVESVVPYEVSHSRITFAVAAFRNVISFRPDVILCGHINFVWLVSLANLFAKARVWLQIHGIDAFESPGAITFHNVGKVDLVTSVSRYTRRRFIEWSRLEPERVKVLPNTFDVALRPLTRNDLAEDLKSRYQGKKILLTVGRLDPREAYKGHDLVIEALPELIRKNRDLVYLVVGTGEDVHRLKRLAEDKGVSEFVEFAGYVAQDCINAYLSLADVFVMPSTLEGFGIVFLESMAAGTPVIALRGSGSDDACQDGSLGLLTTHESLVEDILSSLNTNPSKDLAQQVDEVFGVDRFKRHVRRLLSHLERAT
ncbi:MAG: glycosyltransferase family 4 protein [Pseudomonadales bacterium]|nr:glycosyltransferase family 4 protein [Pseudomonadales bacterium]MBO7004760.1 glycosyltransferase family 4 protein [Pseudomonadales bacterium]